MPNSLDSELESRTTPVQQRSVARVDGMLDAAAEIIETSGIAALTTSGIAQRSGSSVGVVYRYFPNADAVLVALAERNQSQFLEAAREALTMRGAPDWEAFARLCIDVYVELARSVPAFRIVRFGDVVAARFTDRRASGDEQLGHRLIDSLVTRYAFEVSEALLLATQVASECSDALIRRAFLEDPAGDPRFVDAAKRISLEILAPYAPTANARH